MLFRLGTLLLILSVASLTGCKKLGETGELVEYFHPKAGTAMSIVGVLVDEIPSSASSTNSRNSVQKKCPRRASGALLIRGDNLIYAKDLGANNGKFIREEITNDELCKIVKTFSRWEVENCIEPLIDMAGRKNFSERVHIYCRSSAFGNLGANAE